MIWYDRHAILLQLLLAASGQTSAYAVMKDHRSPWPPSEMKDVVAESACTLASDPMGLTGLVLSEHAWWKHRHSGSCFFPLCLGIETKHAKRSSLLLDLPLSSFFRVLIPFPRWNFLIHPKFNPPRVFLMKMLAWRDTQRVSSQWSWLGKHGGSQFLILQL